MTSKTIVQFKKLFKERDSNNDTEIPDKDRVVYCDNANVLGVIPKTTSFKNAFDGVFNTDNDSSRTVPTLDYSDGDCCKFSSDYFKIIAQILSTLDGESIKLKVKKDYPITIETKDFDILLAPRIETDD